MTIKASGGARISCSSRACLWRAGGVRRSLRDEHPRTDRGSLRRLSRRPILTTFNRHGRRGADRCSTARARDDDTAVLRWRCRPPSGEGAGHRPCTCMERSGFSRRGRHARRSACGSSLSSYPAGSPLTLRFSRGCLYRATDAQQVAGDACSGQVPASGHPQRTNFGVDSAARLPSAILTFTRFACQSGDDPERPRTVPRIWPNRAYDRKKTRPSASALRAVLPGARARRRARRRGRRHQNAGGGEFKEYHPPCRASRPRHRVHRKGVAYYLNRLDINDETVAQGFGDNHDLATGYAVQKQVHEGPLSGPDEASRAVGC